MADQLTDMFIRKLVPAEKEYTRREKGGFGVRVLTSGRKIFFYLYRLDGQRKFLNLGTYREKGYPDGRTLAEARAKYEAESSQVKALKAGRAEGADPVAIKKRKRAERELERKAHTIDELIKEYLTRHAKKFKRSWKEDERVLNLDVLPVWGKMKAHEITKRDVNVLLEKIVDRGAPVMANNTFKIVRRMFNYAVEKDILLYSPATGVKMPSPKIARQRALSEDEVKAIWASLGPANISDPVRRALKLILVTAQRPDEVAGMHAGEIDDRWWTIPGERTKNGKAQRVYLTNLALELIDGVKYVDPETGEEKSKTFIFPCPHKKKTQPIGRHALSKAILNNCPSGCMNNCEKCAIEECKKDGRALKEKNRLGIPHFVPHDLRRTAATFMAQNGELDEVIDAVLNHVKQGVIKVYNTYRYDKEKQAALEGWERKLRAIVSNTKTDNVVSINKRRKG
ncbi:MAG: DUF4102 domain-containing protein [Deltaproteobacteria bacterium]|nr:MAG: DUF4102 domain-containing protein [Deltaproteobacteria bacterium]